LAVAIGPKPPGSKRVLWLHNQPEHYFNCMLDDLARLPAAGTPIEYVAAFSYQGPGWYQDNAPQAAGSLFLTPRPGMTERPTMSAHYHADWRRELLPLHFDAAVVSGYGWRTHREVLLHCAAHRIPVAMFSDSNLRSQRGRGFARRLKRRVKKALLQKYIRASDYLLTANSLGVAYWRYYGAPRKKIVLCPYYADYPRARAATQTPRAAVLERHGLPPDARYLFTAARLVHDKGIDLALDAFRALAPAFPHHHYLVAGVGPDEAALKARAGALLGKSIHFLGFQQPADNLALMAHADLFLLPSRYEPHGIVLAEATSVGTPILASDVCGAAADLARPQVSGDLFRSENAADLTEKLRALVSDPAHLAALRGGARETFERWFAATNPVGVVDRISRNMLGLPPVLVPAGVSA
jgi:glycosyltransferase involved in cell wall biosynthesis